MSVETLLMETLTADAHGRITLPTAFANAKLVVEHISDSELRIRKSPVVAADLFPEDAIPPLSDRDRDLFLAALENPPEPTPALRRAAEKFRERYE